MGKPKKIKGLCFSCPSLLTITFGKTTKLYQVRFVCIKTQFKITKAVFGCALEVVSVRLILKSHNKSSSPREPPPQALTEPDVNVSAHPALIDQPSHTTIASEQTTKVAYTQYDLTIALLVFDDCVNVYISSSPT